VNDPCAGLGEYISLAEAASISAGTGCAVELNGREFAVFNVDGAFYAIHGRCPHRGGPLGAGYVEGAVVYCPLHGWGFDVKTGKCVTTPDRPVKCFPARVVDGKVQVLM
jgi:nitrite reductase/ring-hydroxylating ferredoxin subunit